MSDETPIEAPVSDVPVSDSPVIDPPVSDPPDTKPVDPPVDPPPDDPPTIAKVWVKHISGEGEMIQVDADAKTVTLPIGDFIQVSAPPEIREDVTTSVVGITDDGKGLFFQAMPSAPFGTLPDGSWWVWTNGLVGLQRRKA